jgi:SP family general alpha glucoside:H+ symporter-like MFS transporter
MGTPIGQITILAFAYPMEKFGRKRTYAVTITGCIGLVFMQFFAPNLKVLCAGEILAGVLWGGCVLMAPTYTSEITHNSLRGVLEVFNNLAFLTGQFVANGVMDAVSNRTDEYAYKIPFAVQWIWPIIILSLIKFAPESPYWLVRHGKLDQARTALKKLSTKQESNEVIEQRLMFIRQINSLEQEMEHSSSYLDIFRGSNNRRTEICTMVYCIQIFSGIPLCMNYSTYFFEQAGLASSEAFSLSLGSTAIGFSFTCMSAVVLNWVGRRTIFNTGMYLVTIILLLIGFLDIAPSYDTNSSIRWAQAVLVLVWSAVWQASLGPIMYVFIGEVSSTKLRSRTIAFATAMQSITALVFTIIMPYILNPTAFNIRGKAGFIFGGISIICSIWCYFRLPETKGRTFDEIDLMFHREIPARKFASYEILEGIETKEEKV